jgi:hypothetical protein
VWGDGSITLSAGTCTLSSGGTCSITVTGVAHGGITIGAFYLGDSANTRSVGYAHFLVS